MRRTFLVFLLVIPPLLSAQDLDASDTISKDSIIKKLSASYYGAIYKNADSALALVDASYSKYNKDPLIRAWKNHLRGNYFYGKQNADSALFYFDKVFTSMKAKDDPYLFNETKILSGMIYTNTGRSDEALVKFKEAEKELLGNPDAKPQLKVNLFRATGIYHLNTGTHELSMDYFLKAYDLVEKDTSLANVKDRVLINLAEVSTLIGDLEETKRYLLLSKKAAETINNDYGIHKANIKLAEVALNTNTTENYDLKELERAINYFDTAGQVLNVIEGSLYLGRMLEEEKQLELSEQSFLKALNISKKIGMPQGIINASMNLGKLKILEGQYDEAIDYYNDVEEIASKYANVQTNMQLKGYLADAHAAQRDFRSAYQNLSQSKKLSDSLDLAERFELTKDLEAKYENNKKEQEIKLLTSQNQLAEQQKKSQRNILLGGIGITGLAGVFLFILFRNRKKTTDKLKEIDAAKSKFFSNISHEFRTPLTLIANPIEQALQDKALPDKKREQFKMAKRNSDRLLSLVNQLLDLSKIDAGQLKLRIQNGNVTQLISALGESFSYSAKQKDIDFNIGVDHHDTEVYFDKDAIEKILVNLLSNAIKYTPKEGSVVCKAQIQDGQLLLEVKNTGKGLTQEELKNIFQRFYQTSEDNVGTGIGLALVKELVDLHKGTITVESKPNEWTTFSIRLPVDKNSFKNAQFVDTQDIDVMRATTLDSGVIDNEDGFADTNQPILLLVEDNQDVRTLLKQTFEDNYTVISAPDGEKGVARALEHIPDIIISDIMMPVKDGITLTKELKNDERTSHIPIILLTAKAGDDNELKGVEIGADDYITKPFSSKILRAKVAKLIEIRQKLQSRYSQELILLPKDIAGNNLDEQFLEKVQTVLDEKLVESSFSIEDFSKAVGMSRMQLHRKIKAITGLSAGDFIRSQRLKLAADLLKKSDINISEIGYMVGFNDHSYFTKCFKEAYGATPTAFAKKRT